VLFWALFTAVLAVGRTAGADADFDAAEPVAAPTARDGALPAREVALLAGTIDFAGFTFVFALVLGIGLVRLGKTR